MTEPTTPITVHLTDDQMDYPERYNLAHIIIEAAEAQRPRPIVVGDEVRCYVSSLPLLVRGVHEGYAWLWNDDNCIGSYRLDTLTRGGDEATT